MGKSKKQIQAEQANMQSDALEMGAFSTEELDSGFSEGVLFGGGSDFQYSFADLDDMGELKQMELNTAGVTTSMSVDGALSVDFEDTELRQKYPALQDAWDHYKNVKHMCEQKEKEDEN